MSDNDQGRRAYDPDTNQILQKLLEQHDDIKEIRADMMINAQVVAAQGATLEDIRYAIREEKTNRVTTCLAREERTLKLEKLAERVIWAIELLVRFGAGFIAIGGFVISAWFIFAKFGHWIAVNWDKFFGKL